MEFYNGILTFYPIFIFFIVAFSISVFWMSTLQQQLCINIIFVPYIYSFHYHVYDFAGSPGPVCLRCVDECFLNACHGDSVTQGDFQFTLLSGSVVLWVKKAE